MNANHLQFLKLLDGDVQYVVPHWQRRYCWQQSDIKRLVEDVLTIAGQDQNSTHYIGTLLTFPEPSSAGMLTTHRVVDGQQRLTTVCILLACIAEKLEQEGQCRGWTAEIIRERRLTNPHMPTEKRLKLKLQGKDNDEYRNIVDGKPAGSGAVTQAWKVARRLVKDEDTASLLKGLERLWVVSIGLSNSDDPQQIFESLNATGRPLTESEKVKNWLLIGFPEEKQKELFDKYWLQIEKVLGAEQTSERIDIFLRDVMRWRTGETLGGDKTYGQFRRWALKLNLGSEDSRSTLLEDLAKLAKLYGILTGTAGKHTDRKVESELRHLREIGIDVHRPLTLRLLYEFSQCDSTQEAVSIEQLRKIISGIGTWITRHRLADRPTAGFNKAMADLAHSKVVSDIGEDYAECWLNEIRKLRNQRVGVPNDKEVQEGIRMRKAYGGGNTRITKAILCQLMESEHPGEAPSRDRLTVEHIMPQNLTEKWRHELGEDAEEVHKKYLNRLANLTLSGDEINSSMGANSFSKKREIYRKSSIGLTRRIANENEWNEEILSRRSNDLAYQVLDRWPWIDGQSEADIPLKWRIEDGPWHPEKSASQMICNVVSALLSRNSENIHRLQGKEEDTNIKSVSHYPIVPSKFRTIPGHNEWLIYPYAKNQEAYAARCRKLGERCGVDVEIVIVQDKDKVKKAFWNFLKKTTGGIPGLRDNSGGGTQWTKSCNGFKDCIVISIGTTDLTWLQARAGGKTTKDKARMLRVSRIMLDEMVDQSLSADLAKESEKGRSIKIQRSWSQDNEDEWLEACHWIQDQYERLLLILEEIDQINE